MQLRRNYDETKLQNKQVQPTIYTICFYHYHNRLHCFLHSRKIEFEGVCGNGYRGDIALDNITLTEGKCPTIQRNNTGSKSLSCRNCFCLFSSCLFPLFKPCCVSRVPVQVKMNINSSLLQKMQLPQKYERDFDLSFRNVNIPFCIFRFFKRLLILLVSTSRHL